MHHKPSRQHSPVDHSKPKSKHGHSQGDGAKPPTRKPSKTTVGGNGSNGHSRQAVVPKLKPNGNGTVHHPPIEIIASRDESLLGARTVYRYLKVHVFLEAIIRRGPSAIAAKRYYYDSFSAFEDTVNLTGVRTIECDLMVYYLMGAWKMNQFIDTLGRQPLFNRQGLPTDPPVDPSIKRIYDELNGKDKSRCQFTCYFSFAEMNVLQNAMFEITGGFQCRTITQILAPMRGLQDSEGEPRVTLILEEMYDDQGHDYLGRYR